MIIERLRHQQGSFTLSITEQVIALPGVCTAVIGENGAGKSTLFRVLAGALKPREYELKGHGAESKKVLCHDAFATLNKRLRVSDHVAWSARMHNAPKALIASLVDDFQLMHLWERYPASLSAGQSTRLRLVKTLLADPDVVLLDEPTTGLQFSAAERVVNCIELLLKQHKSVVVSTHHLIELSPLKPYLVGLKSGEVVLDEPWSEQYENYNNVCRLMRKLSTEKWEEQVPARSVG